MLSVQQKWHFQQELVKFWYCPQSVEKHTVKALVRHGYISQIKVTIRRLLEHLP